MQKFFRRVSQGHQLTSSIPPPFLALLSIISVQLGAALAESLFQSVGSSGVVLLRVVFAALILSILWRPHRHLRGHSRSDFLFVFLFGLAIAGCSIFFYAAIARLPLGIAVTLEFIGPLGVAVLGSRRLVDFLWAALAAVGVILLAPIGNTQLDPFGVLLALLAGVFWGAYILFNARVGRAFEGGSGLALTMIVATLLLLPFGLASGGAALFTPAVLFIGLCVSLLASFVSYSLEFEALRRLPASSFGVLMSLEPAVAALIGFLVLHEAMDLREILALVLIIVASGGVSFAQKKV
ncbi:MAG TPA: DMT family transporter [Ktedonobacteraceae bacterium]|jgi:inner membrane transporter RhtA|nr:DMT family transporter [Ktedonobacteraceae bacterium]